MDLREGGKRLGRSLGVVLLILYALAVGSEHLDLYNEYKSKKFLTELIDEGTIDSKRKWELIEEGAVEYGSERRAENLKNLKRNLFFHIPIYGLLGIVVYKLPIWLIRKIVWIVEGFKGKE
jgi:hypothetical protein